MTVSLSTSHPRTSQQHDVASCHLSPPYMTHLASSRPIFSTERKSSRKYAVKEHDGLELTAAVVSVTVSNMLKEELGYSDIEEFYWTDSKVVLGYINNDACRFHTFVANRVQKIRHASDPKRTFTYQLMTTRQTVLQGGQQWTNCFYLVGSQALAFCGKKK